MLFVLKISARDGSFEHPEMHPKMFKLIDDLMPKIFVYLEACRRNRQKLLKLYMASELKHN